MKFCKCGKLMTVTETGYECVCGVKTDFFGNEISVGEADRIINIKAKYHSKYPNISDPVVRTAEDYNESETEDETMSSLTPKELEKLRNKKKKNN